MRATRLFRAVGVGAASVIASASTGAGVAGMTTGLAACTEDACTYNFAENQVAKATLTAAFAPAVPGTRWLKTYGSDGETFAEGKKTIGGFDDKDPTPLS